MKTIETFCRSCKSPIDVKIADEDYDPDMAAFVAKIGLVCAGCRKPKCEPFIVKTTHPDGRVTTEKYPAVSAPHNDP